MALSKKAKGSKTSKSRARSLKLSVKSASQVRGGGKRRADGTGGGNVAGGWDLIGNKVHS